MKNLSLSLLIACFICVLPAVSSFSQSNDLLTNLKKEKTNTDNYIKQHSKDLIVLVKIPSKNTLVSIKGDKWPDEIEYTYNILKDHSGKIIFIAQIPYSESGDSNIEYRHYFDQHGRTYAFSGEESTFDDNVKGGIVRQMLLKYFDVSSKTINESYSLMDVNNKELKGNANKVDFSDDLFAIYKNLNDCLSGYNILIH